jgi:sodium/proline symporter
MAFNWSHRNGCHSGVFWILLVAGELLGVFISWQFMAKKFKKMSNSYKAITIPDYLQSHFKSSTNTLRVIAASVLVVFVVIYVASQMDVTGIAFESIWVLIIVLVYLLALVLYWYIYLLEVL